MIDPYMLDRVADLRAKLDEVNAVIRELKQHSIDVVISAGRDNADLPVEVKLSRCWGIDDYITNK